MEKYVVYFRVSTKKQGDSALGMEAQKRDVELYFENYANECEVLGEFTDIDSGKNDERPELGKAVALSKKDKAILLVAKLDRLSRKVSTIALMIEQIDFKVATMPTADKFQLHIYAALAEQERDFISLRTKAALKEAKARGVKLGGNRGNIDKANKGRIEAADKDAREYREMIQVCIDSGCGSFKTIAEKLNQLNVRTVRGGRFQAVQVSRLMNRLQMTLLKRT